MTFPLISWETWEEKFKPILQQDGPNGNLWDAMHEDAPKDVELKYLWTLIDNNPNGVYLDIIPGYHFINRMGYFVTEVPWTDKEMVVSNDPSY